jgi:predicted amidohydrolase
VLGDPEAALSIVSACAAASDADLLLFPEGFLQGYLVTAGHLRAHALDLRSAAFAAVLDRLAPIRPTLVLGAARTPSIGARCTAASPPTALARPACG